MIRHPKTRCFPIFDDEDADLRELAWTANRDGYGKRTFNYRDCTNAKRTKTILAHRVVLERKLGRLLLSTDITDHVNRNRLDCRRFNIRLTTRKGNSQNVGSRGASGFRGVTKRNNGKWQAQVKCNGINHYCGLFETKEAACLAACDKRRILGFLE